MTIRNRIVGIEKVKASELRANPKNWRQHPQRQREALTRMLADVGNVGVLTAVRGEDGVLTLLDGHLRADLRGEDECEVAILDLTPEEADLVLATFDPLAAMAKTDASALAELLKPFDSSTLAAMVWPVPTSRDMPPEKELEPRSERGQVWRLGRHRLMCGDSTVKGDVDRLLDGASPDCILTDPPYNSGGFQEAERHNSKGTDVTYNVDIINDRLSTRGHMALMRAAMGNAPDTGVIYVFTDWRMWTYTFDVAESAGYRVRSMIVWDKGTPGMGVGWRTQHELILCGAKSDGLWQEHLGGQGNVISLSRMPNTHHATEKPVELLEVILRTTPFAESVYDPFVGAGSTIIAAENLGRVCYAMEIGPRIMDTALARWESTTGEQAELLYAPPSGDS